MIRWEEPSTGVGLVVIDRQERRNALDAAHCADIRDRLEQHRDLRCVVITGEGRAFCAGADLARRAADTAGGIEHGGGDTFRPAFEAMLQAIIDYPGAVIAAVNGHALGAGLQLSVVCDLRVIAPGGTLGIPASKIGIHLSAPNIARLAAVVGQAWARDILITGRTFGIDEAERMGLVHRRADDARSAALQWAQEIATLAPLAVSGHKHALNLVASATALDAAAVARIEAGEAAAFGSADLQEGLAAFAEKRTPRFEGR